jgi:threonine-phosphate decarboxylase
MLHGGDFYDNIDLIEKAKAGLLYDFSVNTNPFGMPEGVKQAIKDNMDMYERYPDPFCRALRAAIAKHESADGAIKDDYIICGNGASDLIYRLCLSARPRTVLVCYPTFSDYERAAELGGARVIHHVLFDEDNFIMDETFLESLDATIDMVFLCNPNNPTGVVIDSVLLQKITERCAAQNTVLVIDECFLPFVDTDCCRTHSMIEKLSPHIVVLKAFTKTFSLAGLRVGYMVATNTTLLEAVSNFGLCWPVSVPAQIAALAALECEDWFIKSKASIHIERAFLSEALRRFGFKVYPAEANFIFFRCYLPDLGDKLMTRGILIRTFGGGGSGGPKAPQRGRYGGGAPVEGVGGNEVPPRGRLPPLYFYRVCVRNRNDNKILLDAIKDVLK